MNLNIKMMMFAWVILLGAAGSASAQFDFGSLLKKGIDVAKKTTEASKDITEPEEINMGEGIAAVLLGASPLHADTNLQRYVNKVGRWVATQSSRPDLPWSFAVIDTPTINAFALPGGKVFVSIGLLRMLKSESELAGVLAHEIGHVMQRHQIQAIQASKTSAVYQDALQAEAGERIARSRAGSNALTGTLSNAAASAGIELVKNGFFSRPLDRGLEYEADRVGATLAAKAGYESYGLISAIQMLSTLKQEESGVSITMSTHPTPTDRLAELEKFAPTLDQFSSQPLVEDRFAKAMAAVK